MASTPDIVRAYRYLLRGGLRAVQFSKPARFLLRDQLRVGFRDRGARLDPEAVARTLQFLDAARAERGLEHRILKNLLRIAWEKDYERRGKHWGARMREKREDEKRNRPR
jgi:hypothetical protein